MGSDICSQEIETPAEAYPRRGFQPNTTAKSSNFNDISYPKFLQNKFDHSPISSRIRTSERKKSTENPQKSPIFIKFKVKKSHFNRCKNHPNLPTSNNLC
jgi:hypothetical protein